MDMTRCVVDMTRCVVDMTRYILWILSESSVSLWVIAFVMTGGYVQGLLFVTCPSATRGAPATTRGALARIGCIPFYILSGNSVSL